MLASFYSMTIVYLHWTHRKTHRRTDCTTCSSREEKCCDKTPANSFSHSVGELQAVNNT